MDRKIVFFDIDGTIYSFTKGIPEDTAKAIRQLKANGHIPVICTGRTKVLIYKEFLDIGFEHIVAGAGTYVESEGRELFYRELGTAELKRIIAGFKKNGFSSLVEGRDYIYMNENEFDLTPATEKFTAIYRNTLKDKCKSVYEDEICASKVSGGWTKTSDPETMIREFSDKYKVVNHNGVLLELVPKECTKATGIETLINELRIPRENTYAFGDSFNDLEMLEYVEYGIAMGNSDPEIFKHVKYWTADFDKGGIREGLKMMGLI